VSLQATAAVHRNRIEIHALPHSGAQDGVQQCLEASGINAPFPFHSPGDAFLHNLATSSSAALGEAVTPLV
jgi:hypothetical protein